MCKTKQTYKQKKENTNKKGARTWNISYVPTELTAIISADNALVTAMKTINKAMIAPLWPSSNTAT